MTALFCTSCGHEFAGGQIAGPAALLRNVKNLLIDEKKFGAWLLLVNGQLMRMGRPHVGRISLTWLKAKFREGRTWQELASEPSLPPPDVGWTMESKMPMAPLSNLSVARYEATQKPIVKALSTVFVTAFLGLLVFAFTIGKKADPLPTTEPVTGSTTTTTLSNEYVGRSYRPTASRPSSSKVRVRSYTKKDGTRVKSHLRSRRKR